MDREQIVKRLRQLADIRDKRQAWGPFDTNAEDMLTMVAAVHDLYEHAYDDSDQKVNARSRK